MNIYTMQNRDGWYLNVPVSAGRRHRVSLGIVSRREAEAKAARILAEVEAGTWLPPRARAKAGEPVSTLGALVESFLAEVEKTAVEETVRGYQQRLAHLLQVLPAETCLDALDKSRIRLAGEEVFDAPGRNGACRSRRSCNQTLIVARMMLRHGERIEAPGLRYGLGESFRTRRDTGSRGATDAYKPLSREGYFDADEVERILAAAVEEGPRNLALLVLAFDSGLRCGELHGLQWQHVDFSDRAVTVARTCRHNRTKSGAARIVPLPARTVTALREWKAASTWSRDEHPVFPTPHGGHSTRGDFASLLQRVVKRAGIERERVHSHMTRHSYASTLVSRGEAPLTVAKLLGHSTSTLVERVYAHVSQADLRAAIDRLEHSGN
jgi:integrase